VACHFGDSQAHADPRASEGAWPSPLRVPVLDFDAKDGIPPAGDVPIVSTASKRDQLVASTRELTERTGRLIEIFTRYAEANRRLIELLGDDAELVAALDTLGGPMRRREMTEALADFETSRHDVRVAMFALAQEQGATIAALGRKLGISRQLASRLASEAIDPHGRP